MPLNPREAIIATHAKFFPAGKAFTVPAAGTASSTARPGDTDEGWVPIGDIDETVDSPTREEFKVYAPRPGRKRLKKILSTKDEVTIRMTAQEVSPLAVQAIFKTSPLDETSNTFTPFSGTSIAGWLNLKRFDQENVFVSEMTVWVDLKVAGDVTHGNNPTTIQFEAALLDSALNIGSLTPPAPPEPEDPIEDPD